MKCDEIRPLLEAYLDGELDLVHSLAVEQHVENCVECRRRRDELQALGALIRATLPRESAPANLRARLRRSLKSESPRTIQFPARWLAAAAALAAVLAFLLIAKNTRESRPDPLVAEAVANHVRSLLPGHLIDVESTDQHTVKPWVAQRVDYSPPVLDLADAGYPLVGARLDYLGHRNIAALVYRSRQHVINVFVSPDSETGAEPMMSRDGFHVGVWYAAGMKFVVVSDLAEPELRAFCDKLREGLM
jgi:mycothiol system anti-sigma-R factor